MELVSVAAVAENGVIGDDGEVPWPYLEADVKQYRDRVGDSAVIVGRRTFDSMRSDLPGTRQIVVSRSVETVDETSAVVAGGGDEAVELAREIAPNEIVYVLGGGGIYELFQPRVDRMVLSHVDGSYEGDVWFPEFDADEWTVAEETTYEGFTLRDWHRDEA